MSALFDWKSTVLLLAEQADISRLWKSRVWFLTS